MPGLHNVINQSIDGRIFKNKILCLGLDQDDNYILDFSLTCRFVASDVCRPRGKLAILEANLQTMAFHYDKRSATVEAEYDRTDLGVRIHRAHPDPTATRGAGDPVINTPVIDVGGGNTIRIQCTLEGSPRSLRIPLRWYMYLIAHDTGYIYIYIYIYIVVVLNMFTIMLFNCQYLSYLMYDTREIPHISYVIRMPYRHIYLLQLIF